MKIYKESIVVEAPIDKVWEVLTDFKTYKEWNPLNYEVFTDGIVGHQITLKYRWGFKDKVKTQVENLFFFGKYKMSWGIKNLFLNTQRDQFLEKAGENSTRFTNRHSFKGVLVPIIMVFFGKKLARVHADTTKALKVRVKEIL